MLRKVYSKASVSFLLVIASAHLLFGQILPDRPEISGSITGRIIDSKNDVPIEYATVALFSLLDEVLVAGTISDKEGVFQLKDVPTGLYSLYRLRKEKNREGIDHTGPI